MLNDMLPRYILVLLGMDPIFIKIADIRGGVHFVNIKHIYEVEEVVSAKAKLTHVRYYSIPDCKGQINKVITKEFTNVLLERINQLKEKP
ncbi:hypothetical protein EPI11_06665 [Flavobacterium cerinum]|uniref:Uncharacterized protein n=2 Tax=Flavobacterium cerinum TaxID=2502784 RepID=A0A444HCW3_9FLAO|nr:hypothetical protein EPI11_06665 [Flavobacterium cerinum]